MLEYNKAAVDELIEAIYPYLKDHFSTELEKDTRPLYSAIENFDPKAQVHQGVSKIAIECPRFNGVIVKISKRGQYFLMDRGNGQDHEWSPFVCAKDGADGNDYCLAEYNKYLALKEQGLDSFVAETILHSSFEKDGVVFNIFVQEMVLSYLNCCDCPLPSKESSAAAKEYQEEDDDNDTICGFAEDWVANCIDIYGYEKLDDFLTYCCEVDPDIREDNHYANYGYRCCNKTPCILDYSNFND
jgi:hypothetical protein